MKIKNIFLILVLSIISISISAQKYNVRLPKAYLKEWVYNKTDTISDLWLDYNNGELFLGGGYLGEGWSGFDCKVKKNNDYYIIEYTGAQEGDEWQNSLLLYMKDGYLYTTDTIQDKSKAKKMYKIINKQ